MLLNFIVLLVLLLPTLSLTQDQHYNWLSLATYSAIQPIDVISPKNQCDKFTGLNPAQVEICRQVPSAIPSLRYGARETVYECQRQFKRERWNCTERTQVDPLRPEFHDLLGNTLRAGNRETGFLQALSSAGIVYAITKGCRAGNISNCECDSDPNLQHFVDTGERQITTRATPVRYSWNGCSDNVKYGIEFAKKFLDSYDQQTFQKNKSVRILMTLHNHNVGREVMDQHMRKHCRCHGISGSCEYKSCWLQVPELHEVGNMLKRRYQLLAVQVARKAKKRLRRKERSERKVPVRVNEIAYINRSPNYCERNDDLGILGTSARECNRTSQDMDNCDLLCCDRGYHIGEEERAEQCYCKFVYCCVVKCKICVTKFTVNKCK